MNFPILVIENEKLKGSLNYSVLMCAKSLVNKFLVKATVLDAKGYKYNVAKVKEASGVLVWESIKYFGCMVKVDPILNGETEYLSLEEFKDYVISAYKKNAKFWMPMYSGKNIPEIIRNCNSYTSIILMFR